MKKICFLLLVTLLFCFENLQAQTKYFPTFTAIDLNKKEVTLPADIYTEKTLLIVPFKQKQQNEIYDFLAQIDPLLQEFPDFDFIEIPTISSWWSWFGLNNWIDDGMRSGIQDFEARKRTVTWYTDVDKFLMQMDIKDKSNVCYYLVDKNGEIYWQIAGKATSEDIDKLRQFLL